MIRAINTRTLAEVQPNIQTTNLLPPASSLLTKSLCFTHEGTTLSRLYLHIFACLIFYLSSLPLVRLAHGVQRKVYTSIESERTRKDLRRNHRIAHASSLLYLYVLPFFSLVEAVASKPKTLSAEQSHNAIVMNEFATNLDFCGSKGLTFEPLGKHFSIKYIINVSYLVKLYRTGGIKIPFNIIVCKHITRYHILL